MSNFYFRTKDNVCPDILQNEIENDIIITSVIEYIRVDDIINITFSFTGLLSVAEEAQLDVLLANHICNITDDSDIGSDTSDELVKVSINDTTSGLLIDKIVSGDSVSIVETNDAGNETLTIATTIPLANIQNDILSNTTGIANNTAAIALLGNGSSGMEGKLFQYAFTEDGSAKNKWLNFSEGRSSSETHAVIPWDCKLIAITYSNERKNTDVQLEVRKALLNNGASDILASAWNIIDARTGVQKTFAIDVTFATGDKIGVYFKHISGTYPKKPNVTLFFEITETGTQETIIENHDGDFGSGSYDD